MRDCAHFRMGPFDHIDLPGDINYPASLIMHEQNSTTLEQEQFLTTNRFLMQVGLVKTGQGNYRYNSDGEMIDAWSPDYEVKGDGAKNYSFIGRRYFR